MTKRSYTVGDVMIAAVEQNGWTVQGITERHPGGNGYVPHGVIKFRREEGTYPFEGRPYGVASYNVRADGILFEHGDYDLDRIDANTRFAERVLK